jgi:Ca2+-binding RTX toxin-like protein
MANYPFITFDSAANLYTVSEGAKTADIQSVINVAAKNATILFDTGTHVLTETIYVQKDNITLRGKGDESVILIDHTGTPNDGIVVSGKTDSKWAASKLSVDVHMNDKTIVLQNATGLKAGDVLHISEANDTEFLSSGIYNNVKTSTNMKENPLRESIVEIASVNGNVVTLKQSIAYDMDGGQANVRRLDMLDNVTMQDFKVTYDLGEPDHNLFENTLSDAFDNQVAVSVRMTRGVDITGLTIENAASNLLEIRSAINAHVSDYTGIGAHNKGGDGNGYGIHIAESFFGTYEGLTLVDTRHAVVFSSWNAEYKNNIQVDFTNRDINYHGSPDHSNTVVVNTSIYEGSAEHEWRVVSPGSTMHPYTDIEANTTLFGHVEGGYRDDKAYGWDTGAQMYGNAGNDELIGGASADLIVGGKDNDTLTGKGGRDTFQFGLGDGQDTITDFQAGDSGDKLILSNFAGFTNFSDLVMTQKGADVEMILIRTATLNDMITFKNIKVGDLTAANIVLQPPATATDLNFTLSSGGDVIRTSMGDDVLHTNSSNLTNADVISLGGGHDTIHFLTTSFTFDSTTRNVIEGLDEFDLRSAVDAKIILDDKFVAGSDSDIFTLRYGVNGIDHLNTGLVTSQNRVVLEGTGAVVLANNLGNRVEINDHTLGKVTGGSGNDYFRLSGGDATIIGGNGNDYFSITSTSNNSMVGGAGDDVFYVAGGQFNTAMTISGGDGFDELRLARTMSVLATDFAKTTGIDGIRFYQNNAMVQLSDDVFDSQIQLRGNKELINGTVDISQLTAPATIALDKNLNLTIAGTHAGNMSFKMMQYANGSLTTTNSKETVLGNDRNNVIDARGGDDDITGGKGNDTLSGGTGRDTFRMSVGDGKDVITDFQAGAGGDKLVLRNYFQFRNFGELPLVQVGADVKLVLNDTDSITFRNTTVSDFTADNFTHDNSAVIDLTMTTTDGADRLISGAGDDVIEAWIGKFGPNDLVDMGAGRDTIKVLGASPYTLDATLFPMMTNVEYLDVTAATLAPKLVISDSLAVGGERGELTIFYGSSGVEIDTHAIASNRTVTLEGSGHIDLSDGINNRVTLAATGHADLLGGTGDDNVKVRGGDHSIDGGAGNDTITLTGNGSFNLKGGAGDDLFQFNSASYLENQSLNGGDGIDEVRLYTSANFTAAEVQNVHNIERLTLSGSENTIASVDTLFNTHMEVRGSSGMKNANLDISGMDADQTLTIGAYIAVDLTSSSGVTYFLNSTSATTGQINGGNGNEVFYGNTASDKINGGNGADTLFGSYGSDTLNGGAGNDMLDGGKDGDKLTGGTGNDTFRYGNLNEAGDTIVDFNTIVGDHDILDLTALFASNGLGGMSETAALSGHYLTLTEGSSGLKVGFDRDGSASKYSSVTMATLTSVDLADFNIANVHTS